MTRLTEEDCTLAIEAAMIAARMMLNIDVPGTLGELEKFDAFAPIFEPSMWIKTRKAAAEKRELLEAALPLWRWVQEQKKKRIEQEGR